MKHRFAALAAAILLCASPALAQDKLPPLRTGVDSGAVTCDPEPSGPRTALRWDFLSRPFGA